MSAKTANSEFLFQMHVLGPKSFGVSVFMGVPPLTTNIAKMWKLAKKIGPATAEQSSRVKRKKNKYEKTQNSQ